MAYDEVERNATEGQLGRPRHGSKHFYEILEEMAVLHDTKSHDYASDGDPFGNYRFSGEMSRLFSHSSEDVGFVTRLSEKLYRLSNLESSGKIPKNESVQDTERDICVIVALWMAARRDSRSKNSIRKYDETIKAAIAKETLSKETEAQSECCAICGKHDTILPLSVRVTDKIGDRIIHLCSDEHKRLYIDSAMERGMRYYTRTNHLSYQ